MIIQFEDLRKKRDYKQSIVIGFLLSYYKDLQDTSGVNIPYFLRARDTYKEIIRNYKDLNKYYNKIVNKL